MERRMVRPRRRLLPLRFRVDGMDDETHSGASRTDGEMSQSGTQSSTAVSETTGTETVQTTEAETVIEPEPVVAPAENLSETVQ